MPCAVDSTFDVAFWFLDRALDDKEYLQPQKLHRLLYLAQAYYAIAYNGRKLMPATFVADDLGPLEPTIYRAFELSRPAVDPRPMPENAEHFLDSIWRRFGPHSVTHLTKTLCNHPPYVEAYAKAPREEITLAAMVKFYGAARQGTPTVQEVMRPRVMRSQDGRPVSVTKWMPSALPKKG